MEPKTTVPPKSEHDLNAEAAADHEAGRTIRHDFVAARDVRHEGDAPVGAREIIEAAAKGRLTDDQPQEQQDALEWLLQSFDSPDSEKETLHTMGLNIGGLGPQAKWIKWTVRNVDGGLLRRQREAAMGGRRAAAGQVDLTAVFQSNVALIVEGTVYPPIREAAKQRGLADAGILVEEAFKTKPGLIEVIAGTIMDISGYDPDAARDEREVAAAGN
jgi:hypothetical protein